ncbi:MAG: tRNA (adenosine(37)-N6)-dimethylallyltransferase MiaA [Ruminococcaceae bacterium]|nr:tRNA (adenosine(37)-N6)-dimethylallyltransferase MiaA [Oscillospiraceae bacterium]
MKKVLAIIGPTGCGKTELSVKIAKRTGAEIISSDSMQIYKGMDIGTAKVTKEEMENVPHHMIDILSPSESFSVSDFCKEAKKKAEEIFKKGKPVVLVGGTGLYTDSFIKDIDFSEEGEKDLKLRAKLEDYAKQFGAEALFEKLREIDEKSAQTIHPNNVKRVIRAIEYYTLTGEPISLHNERTKSKPSPYDYVYIGLTRDREELYERIDKRVDLMMEKGLLGEVMTLYKMGLSKDHTSMQALGYKELFWYINGKATLEESVRILKRDSRRYAKRQLTWFGKNPDINWINLSSQPNGEERAMEILKSKNFI